MIVREILRHPEVSDNFDFFNDFRDTLRWLRGLPESEQRNQAIRRLQEAADRKGRHPEKGCRMDN